jgi:hypothetical protein
MQVSTIYVLLCSTCACAVNAFMLPVLKPTSTSTRLYHQAVSPALAEEAKDVADVPALKPVVSVGKDMH